MAKLQITREVFGQEGPLSDALDSIVKGYYEDTISGLKGQDQLLARKFIEEGLIVDGRRVGITEGVEKAKYNIEKTLLIKLLDSRLIRAENTHLGRSFEISHDTLVGPISESYEKRRLEEERQRKARELAIARKRLFTAIGIALVGFVLAGIALIFFFQARKAKASAEASAIEARDERQRAEDALSNFKEQQKQSAIERYNRYIASGKAWMAQSQYESAIGEFERALETVQNYATDVGDSTAVNIIDESGKEAQQLLDEAVQTGGAKARFEKLIAEGGRYMDLGPKYYVDARRKYQEARELGYNRSLVDSKLNTVNGKLEPAFDTFVKNGDTFFEADGYQLALENYRQALRIQPGDDYVKARIEDCKKLLSLE